jgi:hypothetical protein
MLLLNLKRNLHASRKILMEIRASFESWIFAQGRNGLGNIYVWASGDGGEDDDCNCDGYAASMWTISINSAINDGQNAHYDESCSSTLASTFSNGAKDPNTGVVSVTLINKRTQVRRKRITQTHTSIAIFSES